MLRPSLVLAVSLGPLWLGLGCVIQRDPLTLRADGVQDASADAMRSDASIDTGQGDTEGVDAQGDGGDPDALAADIGTDGFALDAACIATREECNARDDNCNGEVDESGCLMGGEACSSWTYGGHVYLLCPKKRDWDEARTTCMGLGGGYDMAVLGNADEAREAQRRVTEDTWIGMSNDPTRIPTAAPSSFSWLNGDSVDARTLDSASILDRQACGLVRMSSPLFGNHPCAMKKEAVICEAAIVL